MEKENMKKTKLTSKVKKEIDKKPEVKAKKTVVIDKKAKTTAKKAKVKAKKVSINDKKVKAKAEKAKKTKKSLIPKRIKKTGTSFKKLQKAKTNDKITFSLDETVGLLMATFLIALVMGYGMHQCTLTTDAEVINESVVSEINKNFVMIKEKYDLDDEDLLNGAIKGMLDETGDPYASFIEEESQFNEQLDGEYKGLGIEILTDINKTITIGTVFPDSPAEAAGLKENDEILAVDDLDLEGLTGSDFATYVKYNTDNDFYAVKVLRNDTELVIDVEKKNVVIPSVTSEIMQNNDKITGYMKVSIFATNTYQQFSDQLKVLEQNNMDSLIIDVRNNTGGRLDIVSDMLSLFMDKTNIIYKTDDDGSIEEFYSTGYINKEYKIVVLVNGDSASASEILAGALSQQKEALLVGTTTYGKGTVQEVKTLSSGDEYKITTKFWLTPNGTNINGIGLTPDYIEALSDAYYVNPSNETDNQLLKALDLLK